MGFLSDFFSNLSGGNQARAAERAGQQQSEALEQGITAINESSDTALSRVRGFEQFNDAIDPLMALILGETEFQNDPFISNTLNEVTRRVNNNAVAGNQSGLGSGNNLEDLVNSTFLVGDQRVDQLLRVGDRALEAGRTQANIDLSRGSNIANLRADQGAARAGATVGSANARAAGTQNIIDLGFAAFGREAPGRVADAGRSLLEKFRNRGSSQNIFQG